MSTRDYAVSVLASLSEQKMKEFIMLFADDNVLVRMESEMLASDSKAKKYSCFREFMDEMDNEFQKDNSIDEKTKIRSRVLSVYKRVNDKSIWRSS